MFNIGIIGCGKIAQVRHIPEYAAHPQARLAGYYDLNQERAQALAAQCCLLYTSPSPRD